MYSYSSSQCHGPVRAFLRGTKPSDCVHSRKTQHRWKWRRSMENTNNFQYTDWLFVRNKFKSTPEARNKMRVKALGKDTRKGPDYSSKPHTLQYKFISHILRKITNRGHQAPASLNQVQWALPLQQGYSCYFKQNALQSAGWWLLRCGLHSKWMKRVYTLAWELRTVKMNVRRMQSRLSDGIQPLCQTQQTLSLGFQCIYFYTLPHKWSYSFFLCSVARVGAGVLWL